jgi:hypothetical protein
VHADAAGQALEGSARLHSSWIDSPSLPSAISSLICGSCSGVGQRQGLVLHHRDQLGEAVAQAVGQIEHPPTSRTTAFEAMVPKVAIWLTASAP